MIFRIFRNFLRKKIGLIVAEFLELPCLKSSFLDHMTTGRRHSSLSKQDIIKNKKRQKKTGKKHTTFS